jgi:hypothetical protein
MERDVAANLGSSSMSPGVGNPDDVAASVLGIAKKAARFATWIVLGEGIRKDPSRAICPKKPEVGQIGFVVVPQLEGSFLRREGCMRNTVL